MYIHSYFTDGFYPWAQLFLKSFALHNSHAIPIKFDAINLKRAQVKHLYNLYDNLEVFEHTLDLEKISYEYEIEVNELLRQKKQIETDGFIPDSIRWKNLVSGDFRIMAAKEMLDKFPDENMLHFDIDTYIRGDLSPLMSLIDDNDICVRFRLKREKENRKVLVAVQGYKNNTISREFFDRWLEIMKSKSLADRPMDWEQWSYYLTYLEFKDRCKWGDVPTKFYAPEHLSRHKVWGGNTSAGKTANVKNYRKDMKNLANKKWK